MEYITEKTNVNNPWKTTKYEIKGIKIDDHKIEKTNIENIFVDENENSIIVTLPKNKKSNQKIQIEKLPHPINVSLNRFERYTEKIADRKYRVKVNSINE